jgi:hypothetical protein
MLTLGKKIPTGDNTCIIEDGEIGLCCYGNVDKPLCVNLEVNEKLRIVITKVLQTYGNSTDAKLSSMTYKHNAWKEPEYNHVIPRQLIYNTFETLEYGK